MTTASSPLIFRIPADTEAQLIERENRFRGRAVILRSRRPGIESGTEVTVHVHDPGRLKELLYPGNHILLRHEPAPHRKTEWDLLAARFDTHWIFIHSRYHRPLSEKILSTPAVNPLPTGGERLAEVTLGHSRIDYLYTTPGGDRYAVEIKGCTLADDTGTALFPDAPTARGSRHLETLIGHLRKGYKCALILLVFRPDARCFAPFESRDPLFARTFRQAVSAGVTVHPMVFRYDGEQIEYLRTIPLCNQINPDFR
jgi:sugar fermentation stimulation protein A